MVKRKYKIKKTISVKQFISEFGENFSEHMKKRLLELEVRCVLTRSDDDNRLDLKHVEHTQHDYKCTPETDLDPAIQKEYVYGQFIVVDGMLYFSERCIEGTEVMQSPIVNSIYDSLGHEEMILDSDNCAKKVNDSNIDYVVDSILTVCPQVSQSYLDIISKYRSL